MLLRLLLVCCLLLPVWGAAANLRLAVGLAKPPYVEIGGKTGMEVELAVATLQQAGHQVEVVQVPQARGLAMLQEGTVDAMITLIPGASEGIFYSQPLLYYRNRAIVLQNSGIVLHQLADLAHYHVASFQNARLLFGSDYTRAVMAAPSYSEHADQDILNRLLLNHRVEVVVGDELIFHAALTQQDRQGRRPPIASFALFGNTPRHVGFRSDQRRREFDTALLQLKAVGDYQRIVQHYRDKYQLPE
ncbi:ABC transporter substrate-binding protein [Vogesella sp. LIG4]|uniref:substrate-binding periplasmic protein n=1 Tax=Vogesella sp. LIG4 TaxID=1192162 RepID=UPI00081F7DC4|nr:transporter substrate-binding domain-containing protein [Vogesella sp. LIG4]SCK10681.1 ABC-type amino acid transport substrate-binding protein [Vogesella sp. LIG4]